MCCAQSEIPKLWLVLLGLVLSLRALLRALRFSLSSSGAHVEFGSRIVRVHFGNVCRPISSPIEAFRLFLLNFGVTM